MNRSLDRLLDAAGTLSLIILLAVAVGQCTSCGLALAQEADSSYLSTERAADVATGIFYESMAWRQYQDAYHVLNDYVDAFTLREAELWQLVVRGVIDREAYAEIMHHRATLFWSDMMRARSVVLGGKAERPPAPPLDDTEVLWLIEAQCRKRPSHTCDRLRDLKVVR